MSVVICTRDRAALLGRCLESIGRDRPAMAVEIVVIDNGSRDATAAVVASQVPGFPHALRCVLEARPGKSHALNRGVREARGAVLLFTDDDVRVEPGWLEELATPLADAGVVAVGGRTLPDWPAPPPAWLGNQLSRDLGLRDLGDTARSAEPGDSIGANMALRAADLHALPAPSGADGPFDPALGPAGSVKVDYEEFDLLQRLPAAGRRVYAPGAVVRHHVDAARLSQAWLRRTYFQRGFGKARHLRAGGAELRPLQYRVRVALHNLRAARAQRRRNRGGPDEAALVTEFQLYLDAGHDLDMALARWPGLAALLARRLV